MTKNDNENTEDSTLPNKKEGSSPNEGCTLSFTNEHVKNWESLGLIPKELTDAFFLENSEMNDRHQRMREYAKSNPYCTEEEKVSHVMGGCPRKMTEEESKKSYKELQQHIKFHDFLIENWDQLVSDTSENEIKSLFKSIDSKERFGVSNVIANPLYHLQELLGNMEIHQTDDNVYAAVGTKINSRKQTIKLSYTFTAPTRKDANSILNEYKNLMKTKGLKVLFSYWKMANIKGQVNFRCNMTDAMKQTSDDQRNNYFSVKEKTDYWTATRILNLSKLSIEQKVQKRGTKDKITQWIEQPLVEIRGGEKALSDKDKYPTSLLIGVLSLPIANKGLFAPHAYTNSTLTLDPREFLLGFKIQTRAGQRGKGTKNIFRDWEELFKISNLNKVAKINKSVAKSRVRKKLEKMKEGKIIKSYKEIDGGIFITPTPTKTPT